MSTQEWYNQKLNELQNDGARYTALNEIRNNVYNESTEITIIVNLLQSSEIFNCLDKIGTKNKIEADLILDILSICISKLPLDQIQNVNALKKLLLNSNENVQLLALNKISKYLKKHPELTSLDLDITIAIIKCLDQLETNIGALAIEILSRILIDNLNNEIIMNELLKRCESNSEIIRCRIYEIGINLAKISPSILDKVDFILNCLLKELDGQDLLLHLNILEILVPLGELNHGLVYLEYKEVFENICKRIEQIPENPLDTILVPGFMKFFGKIAYYQPQKIITGYPKMLHLLFNCLMSEDISVLPTAFDTLGNVAHSSMGKRLLEEHYSERLTECFQKFAFYLRNLPTELKVREFNALEVIFKTEGPIYEAVSVITKKWYLRLSNAPNLNILLEFAKNPFPDIKIACLSYIKVLCQYDWGRIALRDTATFIEYLLDRSVEYNKDTLFIKYEIIKILSETTIFDVPTLLLMKKYVEQGPQYIEGIVEVAVEGK